MRPDWPSKDECGAVNLARINPNLPVCLWSQVILAPPSLPAPPLVHGLPFITFLSFACFPIFFYSNYLHKLSFWLSLLEMQANLYWLHD